MADDLLLARYAREPVVRDRNFSALLSWAGYTATMPVPESRPAEDWVRLRIVAERIPTQTDNYVMRTLSFFLQDPAVQSNVRLCLSAFNDAATEAELSQINERAIGTFMPRFALSDVSPEQVAQWYVTHGFDEPTIARRPQ